MDEAGDNATGVQRPQSRELNKRKNKKGGQPQSYCAKVGQVYSRRGRTETPTFLIYLPPSSLWKRPLPMFVGTWQNESS